MEYASTKNMSREEWLQARRNGIGGSDAAAIMGASPWSTPLTVYADKTGIGPEKEETEAMRQGTDFEAIVAKRFAEETGKKVRRCNKILQHPAFPWMLANIDRDVVGENAGLECKTTSVFNPSDFEGGEVPTYYMWQCQHYMAVTGATHWYLAVMVLSKSFHVFRIKRDDKLIAALITAEEIFWKDHVLAGEPPLPCGTDAEDDVLFAMYPRSMPRSVDLSMLHTDVQTLAVLKDTLKATQQRIDELAQKIKLKMGDAEIGHSGPFKISWKTSTRASVDSKRLKAENPDIYTMYKTETQQRRFEIRKVVKHA